VREGQLRVRSTRSNPDETLTVRFSDIHQLSAMAVTGGRDLTLHGSEEDLRTRILERPELVEPGFEPRETERPSSAGPMDVFGVDADGDPVVVELKRRRVGPDAVGQLARYVRALRAELGAEEGADTPSSAECSSRPRSPIGPRSGSQTAGSTTSRSTRRRRSDRSA